MTPSEKSLQLLATFRPLVGIMAHKERTEKAKRCAIVAVKEILEAIKVFHNGAEWQLVETVGWQYWNKVLDCLNKM